jgi:hypothetical protein
MTTAEVLGGTKALGQKIKDSMDLHSLILKGMLAGVISHKAPREPVGGPKKDRDEGRCIITQFKKPRSLPRHQSW